MKTYPHISPFLFILLTLTSSGILVQGSDSEIQTGFLNCLPAESASIDESTPRAVAVDALNAFLSADNVEEAMSFLNAGKGQTLLSEVEAGRIAKNQGSHLGADENPKFVTVRNIRDLNSPYRAAFIAPSFKSDVSDELNVLFTGFSIYKDASGNEYLFLYSEINRTIPGKITSTIRRDDAGIGRIVDVKTEIEETGAISGPDQLEVIASGGKPKVIYSGESVSWHCNLKTNAEESAPPAPVRKSPFIDVAQYTLPPQDLSDLEKTTLESAARLLNSLNKERYLYRLLGTSIPAGSELSSDSDEVLQVVSYFDSLNQFGERTRDKKELVFISSKHVIEFMLSSTYDRDVKALDSPEATLVALHPLEARASKIGSKEALDFSFHPNGKLQSLVWKSLIAEISEYDPFDADTPRVGGSFKMLFDGAPIKREARWNADGNLVEDKELAPERDAVDFLKSFIFVNGRSSDDASNQRQDKDR